MHFNVFINFPKFAWTFRSNIFFQIFVAYHQILRKKKFPSRFQISSFIFTTFQTWIIEKKNYTRVIVQKSSKQLFFVLLYKIFITVQLSVPLVPARSAYVSNMKGFFSKFYGKIGVISWLSFPSHLKKITFYTEILTWKVELWFFSFVSLEKKDHKTTFCVKISV